MAREGKTEENLASSSGRSCSDFVSGLSCLLWH